MKFLSIDIHSLRHLEDKLLPNTKIEINFEIEKDDNLIWRSGGNRCRVVITRLQLFVPRLIFNSEGSKIYTREYLKPYKWTYLNEVIQPNRANNQAVGNFKITNGISKPRHVFVFFINTPNIESQTANPFLYNTSVFPQIHELLIDAILKLEMEMSTLILPTNLQKILQEFLEM